MRVRPLRRAFAGALVLLGVSVLTPVAHADPPVPIEDTLAPGEPVARDFPADFVPLLPLDRQEERASLKFWVDLHVGGWGGTLTGGPSCNGWSAQHPEQTPVILLHGTTYDAEFWRESDSGNGTIVNVRDRLLSEGYDACAVWALSYDGARGYFTYDDINTDEVYDFIGAVRAYLGADAVDVVAHSLGVTITRKAGLVHPDLYSHMRAFVALGGPNHGSSDCRGVGQAHGSYVCEELEPGSAWLAELNAGPDGEGEAPPGPRYLTLEDPIGDNFYVAIDAASPKLAGADVCNHEIPGVFHNGLAVSEPSVTEYIAFLKDGTCPVG